MKEVPYFLQQCSVAYINHAMSEEKWQVDSECAVGKTGRESGRYTFQGDVHVFA